MAETARLVPPRDARQWEDSSDGSQASTDDIASPSGRVHGAGVMPTPAKPATQDTWEEHISSSTGEKYWFNPSTQVSTYEMPPEGLPVFSDISSLDEAEFEKRLDEDFPNGDSAETDVEVRAPDASGHELPPLGWEAHVSSTTGQTYYFCAATGETTYDFPRLRREAGPAALLHTNATATRSPRESHKDGPSDVAYASSVALDAQHQRLNQLGAAAVAAATPAPVSSEQQHDSAQQQQHHHDHQQQQQHATQQQPSVDSAAYHAGKDYRGPQDDEAYWKSQTSNAANFLGMCPASTGIAFYLLVVAL